MKILPFNNRVLLEEIKPPEQDITDDSGFFIPKYVQERKDVEQYLHCTILEVSPDLAEKPIGKLLKGKRCVIETGLIEEVVIDKKRYSFAPLNCIVCTISDEPSPPTVEEISDFVKQMMEKLDEKGLIDEPGQCDDESIDEFDSIDYCPESKEIDDIDPNDVH